MEWAHFLVLGHNLAFPANCHDELFFIDVQQRKCANLIYGLNKIISLHFDRTLCINISFS